LAEAFFDRLQQCSC